MSNLTALAAAMVLAILLACGGSEEMVQTSSEMKKSFGLSRSPADQALDFFGESGAAGPTGSAARAPREMVREAEDVQETAVEKEVSRAAPAPNGSAPVLQMAERKVISTASVSVEVEDIQAAINEVRAIAESVGGFVEHLTSAGGPARQNATVTIRVPQEDFSLALAHIEALGSVQSATQGSEDVSERFIDLKARLESALREEKSLLALLERANAVSEVLAIERELARVRSDIERFQGQLNFLERRIALATITVALSLPDEFFPEPPSASLGVEVLNVGGSIEAARKFALSLDARVDRVSITVNDEWETSNLSMRVFPADLQRMIEFLESQGRVRNKRVTEGGTPAAEGSVTTGQQPDANIEVSFFENPGGGALAPVLAIAAALGVTALLVAVAFGFYRFGRRRGRAWPGKPPMETSTSGP